MPVSNMPSRPEKPKRAGVRSCNNTSAQPDNRLCKNSLLVLSLSVDYNAVVSQIDRIKEELGWFKVVFGVLVAMGASVVAWLAQNYSTAKPGLLVVTLFVVVCLGGGIIWINRVVFKRLDQLEKL